MIEKVDGALQAVGMDADAGAPYLLHLLEIKEGIDYLAGLTPQTIKVRTFDTLCQLSLNANQGHPLVLAIEDIHWIDGTSAEYLTSLVERLAGTSTLLLCTYRPGYQPPWMHKSYATQLTLKPLLPRDSLRIVQSVLHTERIDDALAQAILGKAEGNPFFLEELTQTVAHRGERGSSPDLPETIQGALMVRIDGLPEAPKRLVQTLAVIGNPCPISLLSHVTDQPVEALQPLLSSLQSGELLYEQPAMPEPKYLLKHALIQDVANHALPTARRREIHERTAQAIEALSEGRHEGHYAELAHHYRHSGNAARAVVCLQQAGQQALQRSASLEAVQHLTTALALLPALPDGAARAQQELDLQLALGAALAATRGLGAQEVEQSYARALCQQLGEPPRHFPALRGLYRFYQGRGALAHARELGEQLYRLAQREAAPALLLEAHAALGTTLFFLGEYATAQTHWEQAVALTDPAAQRRLALGQGLAPGVTCLAHAASTLWCLGFPAQAVRRSDEALGLARTLAHPHSLAYAQHWAAILHQRRRDVPAAQALADALVTLATAQGFPLWLGFGTFWRGWVTAVQGHGEAGLAQMHEGMAAVLATGQTLTRPFCLVLMAEAAWHVGQVAEGLQLLAEALAAFETSSRGDLLAEAYRLQGELLLCHVVPEVARAEACFQQTLALAGRHHARSWELRAATSLGRLWRQQGKRDAAHELLAEIYGWFTEGFDTADLQDARGLLESR